MQFIQVPVQTASMTNAADTEDTLNLKTLVLAATDLAAVLPEDIFSELPADVIAVADMLTMTLSNYDPAMGSLSFTLTGSEPFEKDKEISVVIAVRDGDETRWYVMKGVGQADGTLLIAPSADVLSVLAGKTFVVMVFQ